MAAQSPLSSLGLVHLLSGLQWSISTSWSHRTVSSRTLRHGGSARTELSPLSWPVAVTCLGKRTWTHICKQAPFYFCTSQRDLPTHFCPCMEHCMTALEWIILYLATLCQNESHEHSRCTFWVAAIRVHLGSHLLAIGRFGGGEWWGQESQGLLSSSFFWQLYQGRTFSLWTLLWIF